MSYTIANNIMYVRDDTGEFVPVSMIASGASAKDTVLYTPQTLTTEQQAQARENIGAADAAAESGRVAAENARVAAEQARVSAESERVAAEEARAT